MTTIKSEDMALTQTFHALSMWEQICIFHEKYGIDLPLKPALMPKDVADFRIAFLEEELAEFKLAVADNDLPEQIDALVDLVVVAMGTAHIMGFNWNEHWNEVYEANMRKKRAQGPNDARSKRKHMLDIVKPKDWIGPNHEKFLS